MSSALMPGRRLAAWNVAPSSDAELLLRLYPCKHKRKLFWAGPPFVSEPFYHIVRGAEKIGIGCFQVADNNCFLKGKKVQKKTGTNFELAGSPSDDGCDYSVQLRGSEQFDFRRSWFQKAAFHFYQSSVTLWSTTSSKHDIFTYCRIFWED